ncbi:hypothetical protein SLS62_002704 [Diatrype stigma]|uniref:Large-conductance mechanosensitive channel n=1 Tax=Diatrype stigma TaxID=117547 RepID=A0AAN9UTG7_9PEZI
MTTREWDWELDAQERRALLEEGEQKAKKLFAGFIQFVFSDNILEFAFGLIIAEGFTQLVNSFINDILLPPISVILPLNRNLDEKFAVLKAGPSYGETGGYTTLAQAIDDGAVVMAYGNFINKIVNFMGIGLALYALAILYQTISRDSIIDQTVECKYCTKNISEEVDASTARAGKTDAKSA